MTTVERSATEQAADAQGVEAGIVAGCSTIRTAWLALAGQLERFHTEKMWKQLGYDNFTEWLAIPEISLSRSHAYALVETYRELVVERSIPTDILAGLEASKVRTVLPAIKRGDVEPEPALADVRSLSRSDLRERYSRRDTKLDASKEPVYTTCKACGQRVRSDA